MFQSSPRTQFLNSNTTVSNTSQLCNEDCTFSGLSTRSNVRDFVCVLRDIEGGGFCMCVRVGLCVHVYMRLRVCVRERVLVYIIFDASCVYVCVCARERGRERTCVRARERFCM